MLIKVDRSVLRSRPCSFLRPFFPFFQTGDSPGNSERLHPIADPSFYNSKTWSLPEHGNSRSKRLNCGDVSYRVVVCQPTRRVLVPTASMPDVSTRVWQSIQIVTTLLVGFVSGPLYWTCHLSCSSVGVWPSSLCG